MTDLTKTPEKLTCRRSLALAAVLGCMPFAQASEQSESNGFIEDSHLGIHFRNAYWSQNNDRGARDTQVWSQGVFAKFESGFTQGKVGFGVDAIGKWAVRLSGGTGHAGASESERLMGGMFALDNSPNSKGLRSPKDSYSYGGGAFKMRYSNTTIKVGDIMPELPVVAYDHIRTLPGSFSGTLITSREIKGLEINAAHFTAQNGAPYSSHDAENLDSLNVLGGHYDVSDNLGTSLYFSKMKDRVSRRYADLNYRMPFSGDRSLTSKFTIYRSKFDRDFVESYTASDGKPGLKESRTNTIWSLQETYAFGPHAVTLGYQQNTGDEGYVYDIGDGPGAITVGNSYHSDYNLKHEKSLKLGYDLDFAHYGVPGLTWNSAYIYAWDVDTNGRTVDPVKTDSRANEKEFYNQVTYVVQSGRAKDLSLRARNSLYRTDSANGSNTMEWRLYIDYPLNIL